jgi:transcriptional regulator with XRE-family HTH domain
MDDLVSFDQVMASLAPERRARIEAGTQALLAQVDALGDLRKAQALTQERMAELLGVSQEAVSRMERRTDMLLSTLTSYVEAMGGTLRLVAEFPGKPPVAITAFADITGDDTPPPRRRRARKAAPQGADSAATAPDTPAS